MRRLMEHLSLFLYITSRLFLPLWKLIRLSPLATQAASDEKGSKIRRRIIRIAANACRRECSGGGGRQSFWMQHSFVIYCSGNHSQVFKCDFWLFSHDPCDPFCTVAYRPKLDVSARYLLSHMLLLAVNNNNNNKKKCICLCLMQPHLSKNKQKFSAKKFQIIFEISRLSEKVLFPPLCL